MVASMSQKLNGNTKNVTACSGALSASPLQVDRHLLHLNHCWSCHNLYQNSFKVRPFLVVSLPGQEHRHGPRTKCGSSLRWQRPFSEPPLSSSQSVLCERWKLGRCTLLSQGGNPSLYHRSNTWLLPPALYQPGRIKVLKDRGHTVPPASPYQAQCGSLGSCSSHQICRGFCLEIGPG